MMRKKSIAGALFFLVASFAVAVPFCIVADLPDCDGRCLFRKMSCGEGTVINPDDGSESDPLCKCSYAQPVGGGGYGGGGIAGY